KVVHCTYRNGLVLGSHKSPTNSPSHYSMQPDAAIAATGPAAPPLRPVMPAVVPTSATHLIDARESAVSWLYSQLAVGFTVHAWAGCAFTPMSPTMASPRAAIEPNTNELTRFLILKVPILLSNMDHI